MPKFSPLPQRGGLDAARLQTPNRIGREKPKWQTMGQWLVGKLPAKVPVEQMIREGVFVYADGSVLKDDDPYQHQTFIWFYRAEPDEVEVPGKIHIVHQDERLIVVDKPPFLATTPRGSHVRQSLLVRLRNELDLPDLAPMHRLDRVTSGLLAFTTAQRWRGSYQMLFERGLVRKTYWALAPKTTELCFPLTLQNHIAKRRGQIQAEIIPGAPINAQTLIEEEDSFSEHSLYRLTPKTGQTHQLRVHMSHLGIPIVNDPLYPQIKDVSSDDFSSPLQLLAGELSFVDPIDGVKRHWQSIRKLPIGLES